MKSFAYSVHVCIDSPEPPRDLPSSPTHSSYRARLTTSVLVLTPGLKHYAVLSLVCYHIKVPEKKKISSHQSDSLEPEICQIFGIKSPHGFSLL